MFLSSSSLLNRFYSSTESKRIHPRRGIKHQPQIEGGKKEQIILGYECSWESWTVEAKTNNKWLSLARIVCQGRLRHIRKKHNTTPTQIYKNKTNLRTQRRPRLSFLTASRGRFTTRDSAGRVRKMPPYSELPPKHSSAQRGEITECDLHPNPLKSCECGAKRLFGRASSSP